MQVLGENLAPPLYCGGRGPLPSRHARDGRCGSRPHGDVPATGFRRCRCTARLPGRRDPVAREVGSVPGGQASGTRDDLPPARREPLPAFARRRFVWLLHSRADRGGTPGSALPPHLVSDPRAALPERHARLDPGRHDGDVPCPDANRHRRLQPPPLPLQARTTRAHHARRSREAEHPDAERQVLHHSAVHPHEPAGPYGARALGISAFSNVLRSWREGGPVGIHGTNEPFSIGRPVSHGCVRLPERAMRELFGHVPLATPVTIRS